MPPDSTDPIQRDVFDVVWDRLAARGFCDARGGMEYTRCRETWDCFDQFTAITASILTNANMSPPSSTTPPTEKPT